METSDILRKLQAAKATSALVMNGPEEYDPVVKELGADRIPDKKKMGQYDFVQVFSASRVEMERLVKEVAEAGKPDCLFWICYPKGGGKIKSDIKRDMAWEILDLAGLRPVSQIAIDDTWSAMRGRPAALVGTKS
jgi:hypothetical protein